MKKTVLTLAVLALGGLMSSQASAAPLANVGDATKAASSSHVEQVRHRDGDGKKDWNRNHKRKWNGHKHSRYDRYRGWNRYSYRPYNWRTRGCVVVGPMWFCP